MAGKKENLKPWAKGQSGNPGGRPKMPKDLREAATLTQQEAVQKLVVYLKMDIYDLEKVLKDKSLKVMDHWVARICLIGIKEGDYQRLNFMFEKLFGKIPDPPKQFQINLSQLPTKEAIRIGQQAIEYLQEAEQD